MIGIIIVLKKEELLDDILSAFAELEIFDVSILDGNNLEKITSDGVFDEVFS